MFTVKKNIFISGKAYYEGDSVELDSTSSIELLRKGAIEKVDPVSEVSIKPKRTRKKAE